MFFDVGDWRQEGLFALERVGTHLSLHRALIPAPSTGLDPFLKDCSQSSLS